MQTFYAQLAKELTAINGLNAFRIYKSLALGKNEELNS